MMNQTENKMDYSDLKFESSPNIIPEDVQLKEMLQVLEASTRETELKKQIRYIVDVYKASTDKEVQNVEAKNLILEFFTRFGFKKAVKKYLQVLIGKFGLLTCIIKSTTDEILENINNRICCDLKQCNDLLNFVYIMQNTAYFEYEDTVKYLFPVYYGIFKGFIYHAKSNFNIVLPIIEELFTLMNAVAKQILLVFVKETTYIEVVAEQYSAKLVVLSYEILSHPKIGFDLKTKSGLILAHSFSIISEPCCKKIKYKDCTPLELLKDYNEEEYFTMIIGSTIVHLPVTNNIDNIVIIYSSVLSVVPQEKLFEVKINDQTLFCLLYDGLMDCAKRKTVVPHIIVEISRTLSIISKHLKSVPVELIKVLFMEGLSYAWSHVEHFVDSVRNYAKLFFEDIIQVAAHHRDNDYAELAEILLENVKQLSPTQSIRLLALENIALHMGSGYLLQNFEDLQDNLLSIMSEPTITDQVCKTYIFIMEKHFQEVEKEDWIAMWVAPITRVLKNCSQCMSFCQRILKSAFQLYPAILRTIFPYDYVGNSQESAVLLKCLQYARQKGIELSMENREQTKLHWRGLIDKEKMERFMIHQEEEIRITALASLVESQRTTEMYLDWELNFLLDFLRYNVTSQIPGFRKQVVAYYKKGLTRYHASFQVITRNIDTLLEKQKRNELKADLEIDGERILEVYLELQASYESFRLRFTKQLIENLAHDANYSRRASSLELLITMHNYMKHEEWLGCWTEEDVKNCHNILFDSYESNKRLAVELLRSLPFMAMGFTNVEFTFKYMQRCLNMALDIKPSKTLSAAYLLEVCASSPFFYDIVQYGNNDPERARAHNSTLDMLIVLTGKLIAQSNINVDISNAKTAQYGIIFSIRHILESRDLSKNNDSYTGLFEHLVKICLSIKDTIMPVVCNPSPEGYRPYTSEEICQNDESAKAQMVLLYAWRTIKDMTLLLAEIVKQTIKLENTVKLLSQDLLMRIGRFFIQIFIECKHRGVFEQAYVGFSVICESFWISSNPKINRLPKVWLTDAVSLCTGERRSDKLCPTRRSAGLPFLILSVVTTETGFDRPNFRVTIGILLRACENVHPSNNINRMHCMNVLRMLYRHSKLGEAVSSYVAQGVKVAITGFNSDTWGVRNSATLLYASLMTRMFGVQRTHDSEDLCMKNRLTIRVFFLRYPELFQFLLDTLGEECRKNDSLTLHPVLMILARLYPSHLEKYNAQVQSDPSLRRMTKAFMWLFYFQMEKYLPHVTSCLSNPNYKTRELAARASVPLIDNEHVQACLEGCFNRIAQPDIKDNECHGLLLQVWHLLKSTANLKEANLTGHLNKTIHLLQYAGKKFSHLTVSLYMEVITLFLMKFRTYEDLAMLKQILMLLSKQIASNLLPMTSMSTFPETRLLLVLYIIVNKFEECDVTYPTVSNQIMSLLYGHDPQLKRFCLHLLIYLNQLQNETCGKHALFQTEEMQIPQPIMNLVDSFDKTSIKKILTHIHPYLKCFLTEEIKFQHYIIKEDQVLLFLLVSYYPCVVKYLNLSKQETLNMLIDFCDCDNEQLISAVVSCISTLLLQLDYTVVKYDRLIQLLVESASPAASDYRRLAVCDFLAKNYILYCNEEPIIIGDELQMVLNIVMVLLEDDELMIRNAMSNFATALKVKIILNRNPRQTISGQRWPVVAEKAKEDLLTLSSLILPKDSAVCFIFSWACRHFPDTIHDASEVFERGELNLYAENVPIMNLCSELLHDLLWPLEGGLSYEDRSIFIEEQTQLVTTILLDSLQKNPSPMMLYKTKVSVICALKSTVKFLEKIQINNNFLNEFRVYLDETILGYLSKHVDHSDLFSVKRIMRDIYEPVFNYESATS